MALSAAMFARAKSILVGLVALFLLVAPVCGALCKAQACDLTRTGEKSPPCHETGSALASEHGRSSLHSEGNCGLEDLPVALPADFRSLSSAPVAFAKAVTPGAVYVHAWYFRPLHPGYSDLRHRRGNVALPEVSCSPTPLRL